MSRVPWFGKFEILASLFLWTPFRNNRQFPRLAQSQQFLVLINTLLETVKHTCFYMLQLLYIAEHLTVFTFHL